MEMNNLNTFWAGLMIEELIRCGVRHFFISPGSRSTPLTAAAARKELSHKIIVFDERSSGFLGVGYGQAQNKPAVIITTSGTAVANLLPAVVEASLSNIPLILLSADRPFESHGIGENQTIDQIDIFVKYAKFFYNMPCPDYNIDPQMVLSTIGYAHHMCKADPMGVSHINCMFRKPLEPDDENIGSSYFESIKEWEKSKQQYTFYHKMTKTADRDSIDHVSGLINSNKKILVSIGKTNNCSDKESLFKLLLHAGLPVYADISSGLRLGGLGTNMIKHFDNEIMSEDFLKKSLPDVLLHFGGRVTSKRFGLLFKKYKLKEHIVVDGSQLRYDPIFSITRRIDSGIDYFCKELSKRIKKNNMGDFKDLYLENATIAQEIIEKNIESDNNLSEPFVARALSAMIPKNSALFLSNSMPVRDMELYSADKGSNPQIGLNRGASGIDGILSSSIGFALSSKKHTTLLIGDMAFIHDLNALILMKKIGIPFIVVLINNNGGGIFHFLPISKYDDIFEKYFAAPHGFDFELVTKNFQLDYFKATNKAEFVDYYKRCLNKKRPAVIEVLTHREHNLYLRRKIKMEIIENLK